MPCREDVERDAALCYCQQGPGLHAGGEGFFLLGGCCTISVRNTSPSRSAPTIRWLVAPSPGGLDEARGNQQHADSRIRRGPGFLLTKVLVELIVVYVSRARALAHFVASYRLQSVSSERPGSKSELGRRCVCLPSIWHTCAPPAMYFAAARSFGICRSCAHEHRVFATMWFLAHRGFPWDVGPTPRAIACGSPALRDALKFEADDRSTAAPLGDERSPGVSLFGSLFG